MTVIAWLAGNTWIVLSAPLLPAAGTAWRPLWKEKKKKVNKSRSTKGRGGRMAH